MSSAPILLEKLTRVTPLGIRFWDQATDRVVSAALSVTGYFANQPQRIFPAVRNNADVYLFQGLAGMRDDEFGTGDAAYWATRTNPRPFEVEVRDSSGQFLPARFTAEVPYRGLFEFAAGSPPPGTPGVPLYSSPARTVLSGMAVVRLELIDAITGLPAAWARVDATYSPLNQAARAMSDAQGRATLLFPYPEPIDAGGVSPPDTARVPLLEQIWPVDIAAAYSPVRPAPAVPELTEFLVQRPAALWTDSAQTQAFSRTTLRYGRETGQILFVTPS